jgi:hypothetical protein
VPGELALVDDGVRVLAHCEGGWVLFEGCVVALLSEAVLKRLKIFV